MTTITFNPNGSAIQNFLVPAGVTQVQVRLVGGQGGSMPKSGDGSQSIGGWGGLVTGTLATTPGETLGILVGGMGGWGGAGYNNPNNRGGVPDGGPGGSVSNTNYGMGPGGGGSSRILRGTTVLCVAGGGGGATMAQGYQGGNAGTIGGTAGEYEFGGSPGTGGTQTSGGIGAGNGGDEGGGNGSQPYGGYGASIYSNSNSGAGGGGGWWGGGGGGLDGGGGGGGSNHVGALTGSASTYTTAGGNGQVQITYQAVPLTPTLDSPINGQYVPGNADVPLTATFNSPDGSPANARAWRLKAIGASNYSYWNTSTGALQSTIVWNPVSIAAGGEETVTILSSALTAGAGYNWSAADQDANGNGQGQFASDATFTTQVPATVIVTGPAGSFNTAQPLITWTATPAQGASVTSHETRVFSSDQYLAPGFDPAVDSPVWDSGVIAGAAIQQQVEVALDNTVSYRFYVQVVETGAEPSIWAYSAATANFDPPAPPQVTLTAEPDAAPPRLTVSVTDTQNLFTANDASFETGVGSWTNTVNATTAQASGEAIDGSFALAVTAAAAGSMSVTTAQYVVNEDVTYTAMLSIRATSAPRTASITVTAFNAPGSLLGVFSSAAQPDTTGGWTTLSVTFTAPAGTVGVTVRLSVTAAAAGEVHYVDQAGIRPGTDPTWYGGGMAGAVSAVITRSDGLQVRGASTAHPLPLPTGTTVQVADAEVVPLTPYSYNVAVQAPDALIAPPVATGSETLMTVQWWEFDPTDLSTATNAQLSEYNPQITEQSAAHMVLGQSTLNIVAAAMGGVDGTATFETFDTPTYLALSALLQSQRTVFISDPFGDNQGVTYVRFGPQTGGMSTGNGNKTKDSSLHPSTGAAPHHTTQISWVAQPRPAV